MIEIEIDGKTLQVQEGTMIIEAADKAGIYIPRFCYHKKLTIAANCRMCLIEVEKSGKPLPACATPVSAGMKVLTRSQKALSAQRAVMEFLLINHPLDCPICDQGGECELQDLSLGFGNADSNYTEPKRSVKSENIGPLIETWMTRCIHCTRCVRFGEEIAGLRELGVTNRGEHAEIGTYVKHFLRSELSGNIIDLCPVGALTNKPARYSGRGWEYREHATVAPHDCVGSNVFVHSRGRMLLPQRHIMRAVPRECEHINETWISDRDRYSVQGLYSENRVYKPMIKQNGTWREVEWQRALDEIADKLQGIASQQGTHEIGALASSNATVEELYLLQKMMRGLGCHNVDHRLRENDFSDQANLKACPELGMKIQAVEELETILLIGSNVRFEQPLLNHRINKAVAEGAKVFALNSMKYEFNYLVAGEQIVPPQKLSLALAGVAKALAELRGESVPLLDSVEVDELSREIASALQHKRSALFLGEHALGHAQAAELRALSQLISKLSGATVGVLTPGANAAGAWLAGCVPHRREAGEAVSAPGLTAKAMLTDSPLRAYLLLNTEPELDSAYAAQALETLTKAPLVVCLTPFMTEAMREYADFILPIAPFTENAGTFINVEGEWQTFRAATPPHQDARPAWKILRVLANFCDLQGFEYATLQEVQDDIKQKVESMPEQTSEFNLPGALSSGESSLQRLGYWPIYRVDNLVRQAKPLQETKVQEDNEFAVNETTAKALGLTLGCTVNVTQGKETRTFILHINNGLANDTVLLPSGIARTAGFGESYAAIEVERG